VTETVETLILGAGPTGLGAGWRLSTRRVPGWMICEAEATPGGLASSVVDEHGFTWDLGGHVQFSHYRHFDELMDELLGPDSWIYHERSAWIWMRGVFVPYPFQLNLRYLPAAEREEAVRGLLALQANGVSPPANFGEWVDATFGEGIARLFLRPYNFKVWAYPLEELSWKWIGDRVAIVDVERVLRNIRLGRDDVSWGPNNRFRFPVRGGTGEVWRRLGGLLGDRIRFGERLVRLDTENHVARFESGLRIRYERVLSTLPLDALVSASDLAPRWGAVARKLKYSSTHVIGVGLSGSAPESLQGKCWMYFPESDCPFYRVTLFSHYSPNNVPDSHRYWSLMAEVSESSSKTVNSGSVVEETIRGLLATKLIRNREEVHHTWHRRLERGYPTPSLDRDSVLEELLPALEERSLFSRGRFGAWKYEVSNQDHSFAQGVEVVDRWLDGAGEETISRPEVVNSRR
jgi:protoporphyrinogen oxidase